MSNSISIVGRLTRDAEQRATATGTVITNFSVASDTGFGERKVTTFYNCSYFRKAEALMQYLTKGSQVFISGEFSLRKYNKNDGTEGVSPDVNVNNIELVGSKPEGQQRSPQPASPSAGPDYASGLDDDLPFNHHMKNTIA